MLAIARPRLSPAQVEAFLEEGYLVFRDQVFPAEKFTGLKACFEKILADLPGDTRPEAMDVPHFTHPELFEWLFADKVLDLVEPILGPDLALFSSHFICKPRGNGKRVPWHEDSSYWQGMMDKTEVCTVWLAIDPSRRENGCMQVIPHSHRTGKKGYSDYAPVDATKNVFPNEIIKPQVNDRIAVAIELEPGQASLHDGRIIHGSDPNTSSLRRCGYTMRYISTRTRFNHDRPGQCHQIYLARGRDHAGNVFADPTRAYDDLLAERNRHGKSGH